MDYLTTTEEFISASITLRKLRHLTIRQPRGDFNLRPQSHCLICSPFGTMKSSLLKRLRTLKNGELEIITDFTKAAIEGTISRQQQYVPTLLYQFGGKILAVDEWNSISDYGQRALLSLLENQELRRSIGFMVKKGWKRDCGRYGRIEVEKNTLMVRLHFSCIACAMAYPIPPEDKGKVENQSSKAILSRFLPIFLEADDQEMYRMMAGDKEWNFYDHSGIVDKVVITEEAYTEYFGRCWDLFHTDGLVPHHPDDKGFVARVNADIIRLAVARAMKDHQKDELVIDKAETLMEGLAFAGVIMRNYMRPFTEGKFQEFIKLYNRSPDKDVGWYALQTGVSKSMVRDYMVKGNIVCKEVLGADEIEKMIVGEYLMDTERPVSHLAHKHGVPWDFAKNAIERYKAEKREAVENGAYITEVKEDAESG